MTSTTAPHILVSAYACRPASGSEPGAGYSLLRAAAAIGECWVVTRNKHAEVVRDALSKDPTPHPVHVHAVDGPQWLRSLKSRTGNVRGYYAYWQRLAGRRGLELDAHVDFDAAYHATFSTFWLPMGAAHLDKPLVVGPVSGGCNTPPTLTRYLSPATRREDMARSLATRTAGIVRRAQWRRDPPVVLAQEDQTMRFLHRHVMGPGADIRVHPHATQPDLGTVAPASARSDEIVFAGRLLSWKGTALALHAFARARLSDTRLVYFGVGPDLERLRAMADELGIADAVEFAGRVPRPTLLWRMRTARALLFPSFHDSAGFVVSEALSLGTPVVCLDHGGPGALVRFWPDVPHAAVPVGDADTTCDAVAAALRAQVLADHPVPATPVTASRTLEGTLRDALRRAGASVRATVDGGGVE